MRRPFRAIRHPGLFFERMTALDTFICWGYGYKVPVIYGK
jgi:hypothetical protein